MEQKCKTLKAYCLQYICNWKFLQVKLPDDSCNLWRVASVAWGSDDENSLGQIGHHRKPLDHTYLTPATTFYIL